MDLVEQSSDSMLGQDRPPVTYCDLLGRAALASAVRQRLQRNGVLTGLVSSAVQAIGELQCVAEMSQLLEIAGTVSVGLR